MDGELQPPTILSVFAKYFVSVGISRDAATKSGEEIWCKYSLRQLSFCMHYVARRDVDNCWSDRTTTSSSTNPHKPSPGYPLVGAITIDMLTRQDHRVCLSFTTIHRLASDNAHPAAELRRTMWLTIAAPGNGYFAFPSITRTHNGFVRPEWVVAILSFLNVLPEYCIASA